MAHARAASGASFTLHYYVSRAQEAAFATEIARQLTSGICQNPLLRRGAESAPAAGAGSGGSGRRHPGSTSAVRPDLWPGFAIPARAVGWGEEQLPPAKRSSRPAPTAASAADGTFTITLTSTGSRWPVPGDKTIAQVLQEHGVAVPLSCEMGICGACLTAGTRGNRRPPGYRAVGGGKTGRRAAYCAVLLPQPVGQFSYRSRGISGPSPAGRRGRPVSPRTGGEDITIAFTAAGRCR
ncbi:Flavodoxin reductases (ferredoxin-NADPH reductases) family 1 [Klebsiella pneumoniae]|uniref:Flavodoxin reductases (Ferredoxin-NADPH reductases) family 1 n=1 Tax=Klebsiella pneumoniae TaxID=573 RepID=A0A377X7X1_KLEPN|nr:Flavodoxin reductases (ferredoxin-NADPH reductases) family 1 [Klebsiella pneumoniae]